MMSTLTDVRNGLERCRALELPLFGRKESAVLVPLVEGPEGLTVLLTRRSAELGQHAGEISFPGGRIEPQDASVFAAAAREAEEEMGLPREACELLGFLDDTVTITGYRIRPCVALVKPGAWRPGPVPPANGTASSAPEVEQVLAVPLERFLRTGGSYTVDVAGGSMRQRFPLYAAGGNIVWGATARILANLADVVLGRGPESGFEATCRDLIPLLMAARRVVLTTHLDPDPDGLGSEMALEEMLLALGKDVVVANNDPLPRLYDFANFRSPLVVGEAITPELLKGADLLIVVDTAEAKRLGKSARLLEPMKGRVAVLDHHMHGNLEGPVVLVDRTFSSTAQIIYSLLSRMGFPFTNRSADALYAGIQFDTHGFRFVFDRSEPFKIAGHLVDLGADTCGIQEQLFARVSRGHVQALTIAMGRARYEFDGKWAWSYITGSELDAFQGTAEDAGEIAPFFCSVEGVRVATFIKEMPDGRLKISFRSKAAWPIGHICTKLGGGGHANAGGATVQGSVEQIVEQLRKEIEPVVLTETPS